MKYKKFPANGGEGFDLEDLEYLQDGITSVLKALANLIGDSSDTYIITGAIDNGTTISDGWIWHGGELLRFEGGASNSTVVIRDEEVNAGQGDWEKWAEPGTGVNTISFSSMIRIDTIRAVSASAATKVQRKTKIKVISTLTNYTVALVREDPTNSGTYIQIAPSYDLATYEELENLCDGDVSVGKLIDIG